MRAISSRWKLHLAAVTLWEWEIKGILGLSLWCSRGTTWHAGLGDPESFSCNGGFPGPLGRSGHFLKCPRRLSFPARPLHYAKDGWFLRGMKKGRMIDWGQIEQTWVTGGGSGKGGVVRLSRGHSGTSPPGWLWRAWWKLLQFGKVLRHCLCWPQGSLGMHRERLDLVSCLCCQGIWAACLTNGLHPVSSGPQASPSGSLWATQGAQKEWPFVPVQGFVEPARLWAWHLTFLFFISCLPSQSLPLPPSLSHIQ